MIILKGAIEIPLAKLPQALPALEAHIEATREEPGNLAFEMTPLERSIQIFQVYAVFEDEASYLAHQ